MNKIFHTAFLLFLMNCTVNSQEFRIGMQSGIGTYAMKGLKDINDLLHTYIPFENKIVSNFPAYFYYQPMLVVKFDDIGIGLVYLYQSTGSRISEKDNTGEYRFDMKVSSNNPGLYFDYSVLTIKNIQFNLSSTFGYSKSKLQINEYLEMSDSVLFDHTTNFKALDYYIEPGINFTYAYKFLSLGINVGYYIQLGDESFKSGVENTTQLYNAEGKEKVVPDWNGFRFGLSVFYVFNRNSHRKLINKPIQFNNY
jgi:hypothetical protein